MSSHLADLNTRSKVLTAKHLQQRYQYHKFRKTFSKFYRRHFELICKIDTGLKHLCYNPYKNLKFMVTMYKFREIVGRPKYSDQFSKIDIC